MRFMLDTDACIYLLAGRPELEDRATEAAGALCMSSITAAELRFGAQKSKRVEQNLSAVQALCGLVPVQDFGAAAAAYYGEIKAELFRKGTPCGPFDLLIGAHARSLGLTLVTNNVREFQRMPGLTVENWVA